MLLSVGSYRYQSLTIVRVEDYVEQDYRLLEMSLEKMLKEGFAKDLTK